MCIVTDGADNASRQATQDSMRQQIERLKRGGWSVVLIGVNGYDSTRVSDSQGIGRGASLAAGNSAENVRDTFAGVAASVGRVRSGQQQTVEFTQIEREVSGGESGAR